MKTFTAKFQIGKAGLTDTVIESLKLGLKNRRQLRVSILKSCCRDQKQAKIIAEEICSKLKLPCRHRLIGYTIVITKQ